MEKTLSRQRLHQLRRIALGWCGYCGKRPLFTKNECLKCREKRQVADARKRQLAGMLASYCHLCGKRGHTAKTCKLSGAESVVPVTTEPPKFKRSNEAVARIVLCAHEPCGSFFTTFRKTQRFCSPHCGVLATRALEPEERERRRVARIASRGAKVRGTARAKVLYTASNAARYKHKKKQPCSECGSTKNVCRHHDDYTKPLEIRWLCRTCHLNWHNENQAIFPPGIPALP